MATDTVIESRAGRHQDQDRRLHRVVQDQLDQLQGGGIDPVEILDAKKDRIVAR